MLFQHFCWHTYSSRNIFCWKWKCHCLADMFASEFLTALWWKTQFLYLYYIYTYVFPLIPLIFSFQWLSSGLALLLLWMTNGTHFLSHVFSICLVLWILSTDATVGGINKIRMLMKIRSKGTTDCKHTEMHYDTRSIQMGTKTLGKEQMKRNEKKKTLFSDVKGIIGWLEIRNEFIFNQINISTLSFVSIFYILLGFIQNTYI